METAICDKEIDGKRLTILGKRRPFLRGKYGVLVDGDITKKGSFAEIFMFLKSGELKEGLDVLKEVAESINAPKRSIVGKKGVVGEFEASIIKPFSEGGVITDIHIVEILGEDKGKIDGALLGLQTRGFLRVVGRKESGSGMVQSYSLTKAGKILRGMLV